MKSKFLIPVLNLNRRFEKPVSFDKWDGVWDGTGETSRAPSDDALFHEMVQNITRKITGIQKR